MTASVSESAVSFEAVRAVDPVSPSLRLVITAAADEENLPPNADRVAAWLASRGRKRSEESC
jgi:hypothetical protein